MWFIDNSRTLLYTKQRFMLMEYHLFEGVSLCTSIITARIRSVREGNVFSRVCLSVSLSNLVGGGGPMWILPMMHWGIL